MMKKIITLALASIMCTQAVFPVWPQNILAMENDVDRTAIIAAKKRHLNWPIDVTEQVLNVLEAAQPNSVVTVQPGGNAVVAQPPMDRLFPTVIKENPRKACAALGCGCASLAWFLRSIATQVPQQASACNMLAAGSGVCAATLCYVACCCCKRNADKKTK